MSAILRRLILFLIASAAATAAATVDGGGGAGAVPIYEAKVENVFLRACNARQQMIIGPSQSSQRCLNWPEKLRNIGN